MTRLAELHAAEILDGTVNLAGLPVLARTDRDE